MASLCAHLCQRCTCIVRLRNTWQPLTYARLCTAAAPGIRVGSPFLTENNTKVCRSLRWKQKIRYYSELADAHRTAEAKEGKDNELLLAAVATSSSPQSSTNEAMALTEYQTGTDLDAAEDLSASEEISEEKAVGVTVPPFSHTLRDYVDKSETLRKLVQLGVQLWKLEQRPNVGSMLLRLDFDADVVPRLLFLKQIGVEDSRLGYIISHNPFILSESVENLQTRVTYLRSKNFSAESIASMVSRAPYLLNFSVKRLDNRLAFYQQELSLSASNTRNVIARLPRLLCGSLEPVKENLKVCKIELGFKQNEIQHIVLAVPKVLTANKRKLTQIFDFLHNIMNVPHHLITKFPQVLNAQFLRLRERHLFLEYLGKAQYDPAEPNYISLDRLVTLPDDAFCSELALTTVDDFYLFQKTL